MVSPAPPKPQMVKWLDGFMAWLRDGGCMILDRDSGRLVPLGPALNEVQADLLSRMYEQAWAEVPIELLIPKARKLGVSTLAQALAYFLCSNIDDFAAVTASHSADGTADLWGITQRIFDSDPKRGGAKYSNKRITWPHGSSFSTRTGGGHEIGRGGTLRFLHISEYASWNLGKKSDQDKTSLTAIRNSIPKHQPTTIVIIESTGQGPAGEFYSQCTEAASASSRSLFFVPWSADSRYRLAPPDDLVLTSDELVIGGRHNLDADQLYWRRQTLMNPTDFNGRVIDFKREFPITLEECFEAAEGRVHPEFSQEACVPDEPLTWRQDDVLGRYRAIDWGGRDPFVCLWLVELSGPPRLTVDASCERLIRELFAYRRDKDTHDPIHDCSHGPSALRYVVTTFYLTHHVHIYREHYEDHHAFGGRNILGLCEYCHGQSGWLEVAPHVWENCGDGEEFTASVADRSRPDSIQLFCEHRFPVVGQVNLQTGTVGTSLQGKTEVEQGIDRVNELVLATVPLSRSDPPQTDQERYEELERLQRKHGIPAKRRNPEATRYHDSELRWGRGGPRRTGRTHPVFGRGW